jgi:pterin-4a-carbinolamine dehydratase
VRAVRRHHHDGTVTQLAATIRFVERVADVVDGYERRPHMCITSYNRVRLVSETPNRATLTLAEHRLADKVDAILEAHSAEGDRQQT